MKYLDNYRMFEEKMKPSERKRLWKRELSKPGVQVVKGFNYKVVKTKPIEYLEKYKNKRRLSVFYYKGTECVNPNCNRKGTQIVYGMDSVGNVHVDVCDDDFYPMTVDHIIPKSKGGANTIDNLQPMCKRCNNKKADIMPDSGGEYKQNYTPQENPPKKEQQNKPNLRNKLYKPDEIKIGDVVYVKRGRNKNNFEELGEVIEIVPNEQHPNKALSARIKEQDYKSLYSLGRLYVEKES